MAKGVQHYYKDGRKFNGTNHKMADGTLHPGKTHTKGSKPLVHFSALTKASKERSKRSYVYGWQEKE